MLHILFAYVYCISLLHVCIAYLHCLCSMSVLHTYLFITYNYCTSSLHIFIAHLHCVYSLHIVIVYLHWTSSLRIFLAYLHVVSLLLYPYFVSLLHICTAYPYGRFTFVLGFARCYLSFTRVSVSLSFTWFSLDFIMILRNEEARRQKTNCCTSYLHMFTVYICCMSVLHTCIAYAACLFCISVYRI